MSVFNEAEYQAAEVVSTSQNAAQSNAQLDNPGTCAKKPKAPTVIRPRLEYIEFFEKHTRAAYNVAQVYSFLVFRCQCNKPGDVSARLEVIRQGGRWGERAFWYLHTPEDIARECGKSVAKIESALKILKRLNMIDARAGRHPVNGEVVRYRGKTVTHIRLGVCQRGNGLDRWPTVDQISQMRIIPGMAEAVLISSAEAVLLLPDAVEGLDSVEGNIKDGVAGNATPESTPEIPQVKSGKVQDQKKPRASESFLKICLDRKLEFLKLNENEDNLPGNLAHELTAADCDIAQRLEYRLTQAGIDPLAFLTWLTPTRFQRLTLGLDLSIDYAFLWMGKADHQTHLMDAYRSYLAEQDKFSSSQQIKLCAMAPAGMKPPVLLLYEQNLDIAVGLFSWDQHWLDHQEDGKWGGRTRLEHLRKYSRFVPEMETWITSEAIRERVLDLLGVHDAAAA